MRASPVRNHSSVKAPILLENPVQHVFVMAQVLPAIQIVSSHHRPGPALLHGSLECGKIYLMQSPVIYYGIILMPLCLLIVKGKMLHADGHSVFLHLLHIRNDHLRREIRVFSHILEIASVERGAVYVYPRPEQHVFLPVARLLTDGLAV